MNPELSAALCSLSPKEQELIRLYCSGSSSAEELSRWFSTLDFDALYSETAWLAASVSAANHYDGVPEAFIPRLKGILKYIHALNSGVLSALHYLGRLLRDEGIPLVLLKETALCVGFPQFSIGHLWMAEAAVPAADYPLVLKIAAHAGFEILPGTDCAIIRRGEVQQIALYAYAEWDFHALASGALMIPGTPFLMPKTEVLFLSLAQAFVETLKQPKPAGRIMARLVSLWHLEQSGLDAALLSKTARHQNSATVLQMTLQCMDMFLPDTGIRKIPLSPGPRNQPEILAKDILSWRQLPPQGQRWKRLWLRVRIRTADHPAALAPAFTAELWAVLKRKLRRILT